MTSSFQEEVTQRTDWETPDWLFTRLDEEFHFTIDVCANETNAKVLPSYYDIEDDALHQPWSGMCWMNPPYGRGVIGPWVKKAYESAMIGDATVVCLLPARCDNEWWKYVVKGELRFIRGRIQFVGAPAGAKFPSVIAIFHAHLDPGGIMSVWEPKK